MNDFQLNNPNLNLNILGQIDQGLQNALDLIMFFFATPFEQTGLSEIPSVQEVQHSILYLQHNHPQAVAMIMQQYRANPRTARMLDQLAAQPVQPIVANPEAAVVEAPQAAVVQTPQSSDPLGISCGLQVHFCIGRTEWGMGPVVQCKLPSGEITMSFDFNSVFNPAANKSLSGLGLKGCFSLAVNKMQASITRRFSRTKLQRSFTIETNYPNHANLGVQVKDDCPQDVHLLAPSNLIDNADLVISYNTKVDRVGTEAKVGVLPFKTLKDRLGNQPKSRKELQNKPPFAKTRNQTQQDQPDDTPPFTRERLQGQRECVQHVQQIQVAPAVSNSERRKQSVFIDVALFVSLITFFYILIKYLEISFLKTKNLK